MLKREQKRTKSRHLFGFNGKENDRVSWSSTQLVQDYGFRLYNPAIGKFLSVDPLSKTFPFYTPYAFSGNTPISAVDLEGGEIMPKVNAESINSERPIINAITEGTIEVTVLQTQFSMSGFDKNSTKFMNIPFYYLVVENRGYTRVFRTNFCGITLCTDGTGPAHGSGSQGTGALASGVSVNADVTAFSVTSGALLKSGDSKYGQRSWLFANITQTNEFVSVSGNVLESGNGMSNIPPVDHGANEFSIAMMLPILQKVIPNFSLASLNVNTTNFERYLYDGFFAEELGTKSTVKNQAPISGGDYDLSRRFLVAGYQAMNALNGKSSLPSNIQMNFKGFFNRNLKSKDSNNQFINNSIQKAENSRVPAFSSGKI